MAQAPNVRSIQDLPPPGGYPKVPITRGIAPRGPSGTVIWLAVTVMTLYGFNQIRITNEEKRLNLKERRESRMAILPYLMVEQDVAMQALIDENKKEEAEVMKDNPNWTVGEAIYSRRWRPPTSGL